MTDCNRWCWFHSLSLKTKQYKRQTNRCQPSPVEDLYRKSAMEKNQKLFSYESKFLKFISIQPLDLISVHPRLRLTINVLYHLFWHFVVSHLAIIQTVTIVLNFDKTLDDIIDYAMIGSIYSYGYFCILCYWQFFWGELSRLMDFVRQNFRTRSAKGRAEKARRGFYICQFFQA